MSVSVYYPRLRILQRIVNLKLQMLAPKLKMKMVYLVNFPSMFQLTMILLADDTGTSPSAAVIAGSIFAVVFTVLIIGIIILAIVCTLNQGKGIMLVS